LLSFTNITVSSLNLIIKRLNQGLNLWIRHYLRVLIYFGTANGTCLDGLRLPQVFGIDGDIFHVPHGFKAGSAHTEMPAGQADDFSWVREANDAELRSL